MQNRKRAIPLAALIALVATPALAEAAPSVETALTRIQLADDPLEPAVVLSTEGVHKAKRGLLGVRHNDHHLQAVIDRRSGAVRYELRQTLQYPGGFRDFQDAHYQADDGVATTKLTRLDGNRAHCDGLDPQAACFEVVSFEVPEASLRAVAGETWNFKFKPRLGEEHRTAMPRAEVQALLSAVERYRAARPMAVAAQP
jgi:hypothetical protein